MNITPYVAKDGRKFNINVFPIAVPFGVGLGHVLGIIAGSRAAFTDDKRMEFSAITGITTLELLEAQEALGNPAYYKDGAVYEANYGDYAKLLSLLEGIFLKLDLTEFKASDLTKEKYDLWYAINDAKATRQLAEHEELQLLEDGAKDFIIEE
jgi:hypothetical protein